MPPASGLPILNAGPVEALAGHFDRKARRPPSKMMHVTQLAVSRLICDLEFS